MARIALGKETWDNLTQEKQKEFTKVFENRLEKSYIEKLELYNDQKVKVIGLNEIPQRSSLCNSLISTSELMNGAPKTKNGS